MELCRWHSKMHRRGDPSHPASYCLYCTREIQVPSSSLRCPHCFHSLHPAHRQLSQRHDPRQPLRTRYGSHPFAAANSPDSPLLSTLTRSSTSSYFPTLEPDPISIEIPSFSHSIHPDPLSMFLESFERPHLSFHHFLSNFHSRQANLLRFLFSSLDLDGSDWEFPQSWGWESPDFPEVLAYIASVRPDRVHPASQTAVSSLETVVVSREMEQKGEMCTICQEKYKWREGASKLPCGHLFHKDCVCPWLQTHSTCPVCRQDLQ